MPAAAAIIIPCFNYGRFVREAVRSALAQREADIRIIVVDDGSTDGSSPAACDGCIRLDPSRIRVLHQANAGLPAARNRGAADPWARESEFLAFLDADDWLEPTFVRDLSRAIRDGQGRGAGGGGEGHGPEVSHAYGQQRMGELGRGTIWRVPDWDPVLLLITNLHPPTALVRREAFDAAGGFDESMRDGYEDWDFWLRLAERGYRGVRLRKPVYTWRRHSSETMISRALTRHEAIYRRLVENHAPLFERNADAIIARTNLMLRRHDMNWLDESLEPIHLIGLKRQRARYESMRAVRAHHALTGLIDRMPAPVAATARAGIGLIKRLTGTAHR
jgi:glycosyltransferase involved in cell wall biosynthesis